MTSSLRGFGKMFYIQHHIQRHLFDVSSCASFVYSLARELSSSFFILWSGGGEHFRCLEKCCRKVVVVEGGRSLSLKVERCIKILQNSIMAYLCGIVCGWNTVVFEIDGIGY